jgi:AraC family ethanolamine operon transcriptional activator
LGYEPRGSWAAEITDLDTLRHAQRGADMEHLQTAPGPFRFRLTQAVIGPVLMQSNDVEGHFLGRGQIGLDGFVLVFATGPSDPASLVNGFALGRDDAVLFAPGAEVVAHTQGRKRWGGLLLDLPTYGGVFDEAGAGIRDHGHLLAPELMRRAPALRDLVLRFVAASRAQPDLAQLGSVAPAVQESLQAHLLAALAPEETGPFRHRSERRRLRVVHGALDYLDSVIARPVYTEDLCAALGVRARTLNNAFQVVLGMSPHRYLRLRRLNLARRRLREAGSRVQVKAVALDLGFWHLGYFARFYRDLFGESPSETRAGSVGS